MWTLGSTAGEEQRAGNCCQPLLGGSSLTFSPLLRLSREFSHAIQENRDSKLDLSWEYINRSQTHECGNWDWGRAIPFLEIHFRFSVQCTRYYVRNLLRVDRWAEPQLHNWSEEDGEDSTILAIVPRLRDGYRHTVILVLAGMVIVIL